MKVGVIGLGRMGSAIVERLVTAQHTVVGFDVATTLRNFGDNFTQINDISSLAQQTHIFWLILQKV